jgi:hypothetical protein
MTAQEIAKRFDISLAAATIRAQEIARLKRLQGGERRPLPRGVIDFLEEQRKKGFVVTSIP